MTENKIVQAENSKILSVYRAEMLDELTSILNYWMNYTVDEEQGGFYGSVSNENVPDKTAPKGMVLNSRILWAFSAAFLYTNEQRYLNIAQRAYQYIIDHFIDHELGGVYWSVDYKGKMLDDKKQIYGLAFCIYGLSEYYKASKDELALYFANDLFEYIEQYSYDKKNDGYLEAFTREWNTISDLRLSEKDSNEKKTMNTHLHVIEAYANLYSVSEDIRPREQIMNLLDVFEKHIINSNTFHLNLFMDENWNVKSSLISFGHDIEAAWLLLQCAETTGNHSYINRYKELSIKITDAAIEGSDADGGLWYEYESKKNHWIKEKHSWPQAEAMVGFMNAYQVGGNKKYLERSINSWAFIKRSIKDKVKGEWFWGVDENNVVMAKKDKAGFWKCPYHSTRACLEIIDRTGKQLQSNF
jgi:cellobiose epimerase